MQQLQAVCWLGVIFYGSLGADSMTLYVLTGMSYVVLSQGVKDVPAEAFIKAFAAVSHWQSLNLRVCSCGLGSYSYLQQSHSFVSS